MANGYQAQHSRPRTGHPRRRVALGAVTALIVIVAAAVAANHGSDHTNSAQSDRSSQRVFASSGTTTTAESTTSPPNGDTTSVPDTTTSVAAAAAATGAASGPGSQNVRPARQPSTPAQPSRTTGAPPTTTVTVPAPPRAVFIPPTATRENSTCVNTTGEWVVTYTVSFSGGQNWTVPGGGSTGTEVQKFPGSPSTPAHIVLTTAHVFDTADNQTRVVPLSNAGPVC